MEEGCTEAKCLVRDSLVAEKGRLPSRERMVSGVVLAERGRSGTYRRIR